MSASKKPSGEEIYKFRKAHPKLTWKDVGIHFNEPWATVKDREFHYRKRKNIPGLAVNQNKRVSDNTPPEWEGGRKHKVRFTDKGFSAEAYSESDRIKSLPELLTACKADLSKWRISRHEINVWEGGRFRVRS